MGRGPLPKASRTCWKAFVFYFMERLVGRISCSNSWGILTFLEFSVIWVPHRRRTRWFFQKIKKFVILKTRKNNDERPGNNSENGLLSFLKYLGCKICVVPGCSRHAFPSFPLTLAGTWWRRPSAKGSSKSPSYQDSSKPIAIWNTTIHAKWYGARDSTHQFL